MPLDALSLQRPIKNQTLWKRCAVASVLCPRCSAVLGDRCWSPSGYKLPPNATHRERLAKFVDHGGRAPDIEAEPYGTATTQARCEEPESRPGEQDGEGRQ